ncbi:TIGR01777 family oxidoreductase [Microbacterium protaetiae]|uniref:TIGR01777 family oxidoreductase n=1 Tax=Microbacterium protaetiae TaxID=2509458 RepID=UPI001F5C1DB6|nr:TIGR01777 family oxidoreductase [Microbacterium protaetiae]
MADAAPALGHVVVAGASGLIGRALVASLRGDGVRVTRLVRRPAQSPDEVPWLLDSSVLDPDILAGADAVVGLNGASIGRMPWTARYRSTLLWSRLTPTRTLATAIRALGSDAPALVSASAVGYYGSAPGADLREDAAPGDTFLARLCAEWEASALSAGSQTRIALLRTAPVIHAEGVLKPLLTLTRLGAGGPIGRGTQVWPWISLTDEVRAIRHILDAEIDGPANLTGPTRATANDLGFALAVRMNKPYVFRAPRWAMRLALSRQAADAVLLTDAHVIPAVLEASGFRFTHTTVDEAIADAVPAHAFSDASSLSD